jgi:hypothetical protein
MEPRVSVLSKSTKREKLTSPEIRDSLIATSEQGNDIEVTLKLAVLKPIVEYDQIAEPLSLDTPGALGASTGDNDGNSTCARHKKGLITNLARRIVFTNAARARETTTVPPRKDHRLVSSLLQPFDEVEAERCFAISTDGKIPDAYDGQRTLVRRAESSVVENITKARDHSIECRQWSKDGTCKRMSLTHVRPPTLHGVPLLCGETRSDVPAPPLDVIRDRRSRHAQATPERSRQREFR